MSSQPRQLDRAEQAARRLVDLGTAVEAEPWSGVRPCMPDMLPVVGPAPKHKGLWMHFGHGHHGHTLGPTTGRLLAELMSGEQTVHGCDGVQPGSPKPYLSRSLGLASRDVTAARAVGAATTECDYAERYTCQRLGQREPQSSRAARAESRLWASACSGTFVVPGSLGRQALHRFKLNPPSQAMGGHQLLFGLSVFSTLCSVSLRRELLASALRVRRALRLARSSSPPS